MLYSHQVEHKLASSGLNGHCLVMPQQYLTYDDLVKEGAEDVGKAPQASGSAAKEAEKPSSDLKMALFEKASLKKALYCSVMKRLLNGNATA